MYVQSGDDAELDISSALARNGAIVYIVGRRKEKLDQAVKMHEFVRSLLVFS